jgi:hypothetical protein
MRLWKPSLIAIAFLLTAGALRSSAAGCQGQCVNPHPGAFKSWNEPVDGCRVKTWRQWPDGCLHYQGYNTCTGAWDNKPDGTPDVHWTCCVH